MMNKVAQFSVFLANKAGVMSQIFRSMAKAKVNISALAMMDAAEHGVLRMITDNASETRRVLNALNIPVTETDVLAVPLPNKPGAVADICEKLTAGKITISYLYCTTGSRTGKAVAMFTVPDIKKAVKVLEKGRSPHRAMKIQLRRPSPQTRR